MICLAGAHSYFVYASVLTDTFPFGWFMLKMLFVQIAIGLSIALCFILHWIYKRIRNLINGVRRLMLMMCPRVTRLCCKRQRISASADIRERVWD